MVSQAVVGLSVGADDDHRIVVGDTGYGHDHRVGPPPPDPREVAVGTTQSSFLAPRIPVQGLADGQQCPFLPGCLCRTDRDVPPFPTRCRVFGGLQLCFRR